MAKSGVIGDGDGDILSGERSFSYIHAYPCECLLTRECYHLTYLLINSHRNKNGTPWISTFEF